MAQAPRPIPEMPAVDRFKPGTIADGIQPRSRRGYVYANQALSARPEQFSIAVKRALVSLHNDSVWGVLQPPLDDVMFSKVREAVVRVDLGELDLRDPQRVEAVQMFMAQVVEYGFTTEISKVTEESPTGDDASLPVDEASLDAMIKSAIERRNDGPVYGQGGAS